jgi:hypothetical protein
MKTNDVGAADPDTKMTFDSIIAHSGSGIRDKGQDAEVWVNGQKAAVYGSEVLAHNDKFTALFYLDRLGTASGGPDAQRLGTFTGFTIKADGQIAPGDPSPGAPQPIDPKRASGADGIDIAPPPPLDYGAGPGVSDDQPSGVNPDSASDAPPPPKKDYGAGPTPASDDATRAETTGTGPVELGGPGKKGGGDADDGGAGAGKSAGGSVIDPGTYRAAIDRLMERIGARTSALDLIEKVGLSVVPASLGAGFGLPTGPELDYGSALKIARTLRQTLAGDAGGIGGLASGTSSGQVLRLLSGDGIR